MMRARWRDDEGTLPLAMLLIIVGSGLSLVLMSTVLREIGATRTETGRESALMAARTGLSSAVASLRAARDANGAGDPALLPCPASSGSPHLAGTVGAAGGTYTASILYLAADPSDRDLAWVQARGRPCAAQLGQTPRFAYITSVGTGAIRAHRRTLYGTYAFRSAVQGNVPGGHFRVYKTPAAVNDLCLDAGALPMPGVVLTMRTCATTARGDAVPRQKFGYQPNLTVSLVTADPSLYPEGLCAEAGSPQAAGQVLTLQRCGTTTLWRQQWSFNFASSFLGTSDGRTLNNVCWSIENPDTPGTRILLNDTSGGLGNGNSACNTNFPNNYQSWNMAAEVGPGAAGPATGQLVNFKQYGKCLDHAFVPDDQKTFPCKQAPDPTIRDWNQVWYLPESGGTGTVYHVKPVSGGSGDPYCLQAPPLNTVPPHTSVVPCPAPGAAVPADLTWRVRGANTPTYDEAYRIEGTGTWAGYCLAAMPEVAAGVQGSRVGVKPCSGDRLQKWNAEPPVGSSGLRHVGER